MMPSSVILPEIITLTVLLPTDRRSSEAGAAPGLSVAKPSRLSGSSIQKSALW